MTRYRNLLIPTVVVIAIASGRGGAGVSEAAVDTASKNAGFRGPCRRQRWSAVTPGRADRKLDFCERLCEDQVVERYRDWKGLMSVARLAVAVMVLLGVTLAASGAQQGKSPDGVMELSLPEGAGLRKFENAPAPISALWMTDDGSLRVAITIAPVPANVKRLAKKGLEEGMLAEIKGNLISSEVKNIGGHEVFVMSAATSVSGSNQRLIQAVFLYEGNGYKAMAFAPADDAEKLRIATECVNSLHIIPPASGGASGTVSGAGTDVRTWDVNEWSRKIGGGAGVLLIGIMIVYLLRQRGHGGKLPGAGG
jgi:hypothetical protein